jgi:hypothetical protein
MVPLFQGRVIDGSLQLYQKRDFVDYLKTLEGREVELSLQRWRDRRTLRQNAYLWSVVYKLISDHTGYTTEEVHDFCKDKFLGTKILRIGDEEREVKKCTHDLPRDKFFEDYIDPIRMWSSQELNIIIPDPNKVQA